VYQNAALNVWYFAQSRERTNLWVTAHETEIESGQTAVAATPNNVRDGLIERRMKVL
jgi:hypothetical protein